MKNLSLLIVSIMIVAPIIFLSHSYYQSSSLSETIEKDAMPSVSTEKIENGNMTKIVAQWEWIDIVNFEPIGDLEYGDSCGIEYGGTISVVGIDGDDMLVKYTASGDTWGTACPSGVLFLTTPKKFRTMTEEFFKIKALKEYKKNLVKKLLTDEYNSKGD